MGSAWHSRPTAIVVSSGFLGNLWKTGFVYILDLRSAQSGNLNTEVGIQVPSCLLKIKTSVGRQIFFCCFFFLEIADCSQEYWKRENKRKGNKEECKQPPFVEAFWYGLGACFWRWIPFMTWSWGAQAAFLPHEAKLKDALQGHSSTFQPEMDIQSVGTHEGQSELKHPATHAVRMWRPLYQLFCFTDPVLQHHVTCSNLSFKYCTLLRWPKCCKAILGAFTLAAPH